MTPAQRAAALRLAKAQDWPFSSEDVRKETAALLRELAAAPQHRQPGRIHSCDMPGCVTCQNPERSDE